MSCLETFFHGTDSRFGIFYPSNCVIAVFSTFQEAASARDRLHSFGFSRRGMLAVPGDDVVEHSTELRDRGGLLGHLMTRLSRLSGTEAVHADEEFEMARDGCALLAVRTPTTEMKQVACALLEAAHPLVVRFYSLAGIEVVQGAGAPHSGFDKRNNN